METFGPLVDGDWLATHLEDPDLRVLDFRWYLDGRPGRAAYDAGHIPGAVFVDLEGEVTGHQPGGGRHPLPERDAFERAMRAAGVRRGRRVVAYDDQGAFVAARLWWLLHYFGHDAVAVLDGGLQAWTGPLQTEPVVPPPGDFVAAPPREEMKLEFGDVRALPSDVLLLDARAPERFRGEVEPVDPRPGHIPGARSAHFLGNLQDDLRFRSPEELRHRFEELGARDAARVVAYCGSGVSACNNLLAMELAGLTGARLYPGSYSDWSSRPDAPIATGED
jgi:thiosulfate/3-mercaptopyruvate sulfurtransferase